MEPALNEIIAFRREGAKLVEYWDFILSSPQRQRAWQDSQPMGKLDIQLWSFLLKSEKRRHEIEKWEKEYLSTETSDVSNISWWDFFAFQPNGINQYATKIIKKMGQQAIPILLKQLNNEKLAPWVIEILGKLGASSKEAIPELLSLLKKEKELRSVIVVALGKIGKQLKEDTPVELLKSLFHSYLGRDELLTHQSYNALFAETLSNRRHLVPQFIELLAEKNTTIRLIILAELNRIKGKEIKKNTLLIAALQKIAIKGKKDEREIAQQLLTSLIKK